MINIEMIKMENQEHNINVYNKHVTEYISRFMSLDLYRDSFDRYLEFLPIKARVIDLGCGPGNVSSYLKSKREDLQILGIDLAPEMIEQARIRNPTSTFEVMDIRNQTLNNSKFEGIISAFSLPYVPRTDISLLFKTIRQLSANNAVLYLSCMEGPKERSGFEKTSFTGNDELYINYYEREEIQSLLTEQNFTVNGFFTKDYKETDGSITTDLIFIARRQK